MKTYIAYTFVFILSLWVLASCERKLEIFEFDCKDCFQDKPENGPLKIWFTLNEENPFVPYTIFIGAFEDGKVEYADTAFNTTEYIDVPVNEYYSVKAEYTKKEQCIDVVDGDRLNLKKNNNRCDKKCYYYKGGKIDVRLK